MSNSQNGSEPKGITNQPLPASHKIYVPSANRADVRVAMRAIHLADQDGHHNGNGHGQSNKAPLTVYDTSGPYTDPNVKTDIRQGLTALRQHCIRARVDVEALPGPIDHPPAGRNAEKNGASELFPDAARRPILRAKSGCNVSQ